MMRRALALIATLIASPVDANEHISAAQQCVWSCLYGVGDANPASEAYYACVANSCAGLEEGVETGSAQPPDGAWTAGQTADGRGAFANIDAANGRSLAWVCDGTRSYLVLDPELDGPGGVLPILVDGTRFDITFTRNPDWLEADDAPAAPLLAALSSGRVAELLNTKGALLARFSLGGSSAAMGQVADFCL